MVQQASERNFKPREDRRLTVLPARMRIGSGWGDACILNISSRGLMIYARCTVQPGNYVELHRGGQRVVARVIWRKDQRLGLCSQDRLPFEDILSSDTAAAASPAIAAGTDVERRGQPRNAERSREHSRAIQFIAMVLIGTALAGQPPFMPSRR